jgi:hypothetical protein
MPKRKETETVQVGLRIREALRAQIESDAEALGVSMNALISDRLERAFNFRAHARLRYGSVNAAIIELVERALVFGRVNSEAEPSEWIEDATALDLAVRAINHILDGLRPPGKIEEAPANPKVFAERLLNQLGNEDKKALSSRWSAELREDLGEAAAARLIERRRGSAGRKDGGGQL